MGVDGKAGKGEADAANGGHGVAKGCCHVVLSCLGAALGHSSSQCLEKHPGIQLPCERQERLFAGRPSLPGSSSSTDCRHTVRPQNVPSNSRCLHCRVAFLCLAAAAGAAPAGGAGDRTHISGPPCRPACDAPTAAAAARPPGKGAAGGQSCHFGVRFANLKCWAAGLVVCSNELLLLSGRSQ